MKLLAIDPGDVLSAYVLIETETLEILNKGKVLNSYLVNAMFLNEFEYDMLAIEMVASYGMAVGKTVFETCVWIGRFIQAVKPCGHTFVYRKDEKINLCGSMKAKDTNIRQALIDRFAKHDFKSGKGVKANPDYFYGFSADMWSAMAVAVTYIDMYLQ